MAEFGRHLVVLRLAVVHLSFRQRHVVVLRLAVVHHLIEWVRDQ